MDWRLRRGAMLVSGALLAAGSLAGMQVAATARVERGAGAGAGVTTRVSVADDGAQANERSGGAVVSADGRFVAFVSKASNLVPGDTNGKLDVFVRDRTNGTTRLVSVSSGGVQGSRPSESPSISSDGRFVAFSSYSPELVPGDTNDRSDVFVRDLQTETTERVSIRDDEGQINWSSVDPEISGDGRFVFFSGVFVRDREAGTTQHVPRAGGSVAISEHGRFVAFRDVRCTPNDTDHGMSICVLDRRTRTTRTASTKGFFIGSFSMSGNGRYVAYDASPRHNRTADPQVYIRDMRSKTVRIASVNSRGVPSNDGAGLGVLSRDGHYLAFWSASTNLAPRTTRRGLVYGRDLRTGVTRPIPLSSSGRQPARILGIAFSATARVIAFTSPATNLVPNDTNGWADVFVRVQRNR